MSNYSWATSSLYSYCWLQYVHVLSLSGFTTQSPFLVYLLSGGTQILQPGMCVCLLGRVLSVCPGDKSSSSSSTGGGPGRTHRTRSPFHCARTETRPAATHEGKVTINPGSSSRQRQGLITVVEDAGR